MCQITLPIGIRRGLKGKLNGLPTQIPGESLGGLRRLVRCEEDDSATLLEGPGQFTQLAASGGHPRNGFDNAEQRQAKTT